MNFLSNQYGYDEDGYFEPDGGFDGNWFFDQLSSQDELYFLRLGSGGWDEGRVFGGSDTYFAESSANTREARLDLTSQMTNKWKIRVGFDIKKHLLTIKHFYSSFFIQQFFQSLLFHTVRKAVKQTLKLDICK